MNPEAHVEFLDYLSSGSTVSHRAGTKELCLEVQQDALNLQDEKPLSTSNSQLIPHKSQEEEEQQRQSCPRVV